MANRPQSLPRWANVPTVNGTTGQNNIIEPAEAVKDLGFDYLEKPKRNNVNWLHNLVYEWVKHFSESEHFAPIEQAVPDMTILIKVGRYRLDVNTSADSTNSQFISKADQSTATITAPVTNPRIDRVYLDPSNGDVGVITGAEAGSPTAPDYNTAPVLNPIPIAQISLIVGQTSIVNTDITNERIEQNVIQNATTTIHGAIKGATNAEAQAKSRTDAAITPGNLSALDASTTLAGLVERLTNTESRVGTDSSRYLTTSNLHYVIGKGCLVYITSSQSIPDATFTSINFSSEDHDDELFHDNTTNNQRIVIPSGSGITKIQFFGQLIYDTALPGSLLRLQIHKNHTTDYNLSIAYAGAGRVTDLTTGLDSILQVSTSEISVVDNDYFELATLQSTGGALDALGSSSGAATWLAMKVIK